MSKSADNDGRPAEEAFEALEGAVGRALERLMVMTRRAETAERRSSELNELMRRFTGNPEEAGDLLSRLKTLEEENADLRSRLAQGRAGVDRLLSKIRFLENQR